MTPKIAPSPRPAIGLRLPAAAAAVLAAAALALALAPASASASHTDTSYFTGLGVFGSPTATQLNRARSARVKTMRIQLNWAYVEPRKGEFSWSRYDRVIVSAASRGVRIMPMLLGTPRWVSSRQTAAPRTSTARSYFARFAQMAAARYGPNGTLWRGSNANIAKASRPLYWQHWNEPNTNVFWDGRPNPGEYAKLLRVASDAANRGDSEVRILTAGLTYPAPGQGWDARTFLRGMFRADPGIGRKFSAVGLHPYALTPSRVVEGIGAMRSTMNSIRTYRPIYVTEIGWSSASPNGRLQVGRTKQASYLKELYYRLLGRGGYSAAMNRYNVMGAIWFCLQDINHPDLTWSKTTGLLDTDRAKPSWWSLLRVTGARQSVHAVGRP